MPPFPLPPLKPCRFLRRRNRFLVEADVGPLHLANSGRMGELLLPGAPCFYHPHPAPKTLGRVLLVESQGVLVGVDATLANRLLEILLREGRFGPLEALEKEVRLGGERLDFRARLGGNEALLEAKNCNRVEARPRAEVGKPSDRTGRKGATQGLWGTSASAQAATGYLALFPDAPTARGARHLRLLAGFARGGGLAYAVWFVQHPLAQAFALDPEDRALFQAAKEAEAAGVRLLAYRVRPALEALHLEGELPWVWLPAQENLEGHHQGHG
ncbi:DNA/RNA nuclease SfsA [Thermus caliditerrae]|uniref:DNA/RNA nuclease SfsA n=1 Tax=Thermus caliditerrae TaxID=1330700 RepID=UPI001F4703BB|nr:DNA/RNA nuclease SfsA [Thermus caliditerrae]